MSQKERETEVTEEECPVPNMMSTATKNIHGELGYGLVTPDNIHNIINAVFSINYMKYLENLVNKGLYLFRRNTDLKIKETSIQDLYDKIKSISKIHIIIDSIIICEIDENYISFDLCENNTVSSQIIYDIYAKSIESLNSIREKVKNLFHDLSSTEERYIYISWFYNTPEGYKSIILNDKLCDTFYKEAYPYLDLEEISKNYLEGEEPIIVLLGPPGTGKTRLIRYILHSFCNRKDKNINVMVTSDQQIIEQGSLFINFIGSYQDVLVLEDIDYHLTARRDGNAAMYNFLSISNGLAIGHQKYKKIILSTNLPNVKNIDSALLRPGRCFGILETRLLYYDESKELLKKINISGELNPKKEYSLAELYNIGKKSGEYLINKKSTGFL